MNNAATPQDSPSARSSTVDGSELVPRVTIDWYRSLPWLRLLSQAVGISWRASHLILAAIAVGAISFGWRLGEMVFDPEGVCGLPFLTAFDQDSSFFERIKNGAQSLSVENLKLESISAKVSAYFAFGILWTIGVCAFAGGLLARRSLMEMGIRSSVGWGPSCALVCKRWLSMVWGISMPLIAMIGLAMLPTALGVIARTGIIGQSVAIVLMIPATFLAIGMGWCAAISALGFPLSICAITAEKNADAFDGVSRSAAYLFQRPMTLLVILTLAFCLAWLGDFVVQTVLSFGEQVLWAAFSIGLGGDIQDRINDENALLVSLLWFAKAIVPALRAAFLFSFFWSAAAAAYLTLRWEIDHTDFDELDLQELGEPVALPQFKKDAREVSEVVESST